MTEATAGAHHRFQDEWLVRLISRLPDPPVMPVERWRQEGVPFLSQALLDAGILTFEMLAALIRNAYRIESVTLDRTKLDRAILALVPENVARRHRVVPVGADARAIRLAMANPLDAMATQDVHAVTGREVVPLFCPPGQLHELELDQLDPEALVYDLVRKLEIRDPVEVIEREGEDGASSEEVAETGVVRPPVVQLVNGIIAQAVHMGVSDIHLEHDEASSIVRFRMDGVLRNMMVLPRYVATGPMVARIKIMAGLDVSNHFRPQDGRAKLRVGDTVVGLRVSTLPSQNGEKVVLRILNEKSIQVSLDGLGIHPPTLRRLRQAMAAEQGVVLVTGPTGSGKTTTLYATLREVASESLNVVTVEDPVEYRLPGITQVQVNEKQGLTFAGVLRSVLRQDPDIILVGEIRDAETARVALHAAQTGHMVLSTLHANDTVGAVVRLADLGVDAFDLAASLVAVSAQRLVRRVCESCAQPAPKADLPPVVLDAMSRLDMVPEIRRGAGCNECRFTGYRGRLPLVELLEVNDRVRDAIGRGERGESLAALARSIGALRTLNEDILWHLAGGRTTLEECGGYLNLDGLALLGAAPAGEPDVEAVAPPRPELPPSVEAVAPPRPELPPSVEAVAPTRSEFPPPADVPKPAGGDDGSPLRVVVAAASPVAAAALEAAGMDVSTFGDGAAALVAVARLSPEVLVVGPGLSTLDAAQVITTLRTVMGLVDLPILSLGGAAGGESRVDDVLPPDAALEELVGRVRAAGGRRHPWPDERTVAEPPVPPDEIERLRSLHALELLDTPPEERFDRLTREARESLGTPMAAISLVDGNRQWFKSRQGFAATETPRAMAFCAHGINFENGLVVPDARLDIRFAHNPLVDGDPNIRFYAGRPIRSPDGHRVGMLCVLDDTPRELSAAEDEELGTLRDRVEKELWPGE